jgi:predicted negative regulator of RcsB-dependent stress response
MKRLKNWWNKNNDWIFIVMLLTGMILVAIGSIFNI